MEFSSSSSDEEDVVFNLDKESFLPSIGPPKILQYVKESVIPPFKDVCPDGNTEDKPEEYFVDHSCAFCNDEIAEKVEDQQHISPEEKVCS